jgi:hypothetical protein
MIKHETPPLACRPHGYLMARWPDITNVRRRLSTRSWCHPPSRGRYVAGRQSLRQRHRQSGSRGGGNMPAATRPPDRSKYGSSTAADPLRDHRRRHPRKRPQQLRIRGSNPSTSGPAAARRYLGGPSLGSAVFTVLREQPTTGASSTPLRLPTDLPPILHDQHLLPPWLDPARVKGEVGQSSVAAPWPVFSCRRHVRPPACRRCLRDGRTAGSTGLLDCCRLSSFLTRWQREG